MDIFNDNIDEPPHPDPELIDFVRTTCALPDFETGDDYFDSDCLHRDNWYRLAPGCIRLQRCTAQENTARVQNNPDNIKNWKRTSKSRKLHRIRKCEQAITPT